MGPQGKCEPWASAEPSREGHTLPKAAVSEHSVDVLHSDTAAIVDMTANIRGRGAAQRGECVWEKDSKSESARGSFHF